MPITEDYARKLNDARQNMIWVPQKGPQVQAFLSEADVMLYGGAAGGGKTALAVGLSAMRHRETLFIRREAKQLDGVVTEYEELLNGRDGLNASTNVWRLPKFDGVARRVTFGSVPHAGDENRYQGRPRDLLVLDEAANLLESQARFLMGWVRTTVKGQRCRTLMCSNPPTSAEGEWLIRMFAPWIDPAHKNPAKPGELRWYTTIAGEDLECPNGEPFTKYGETFYPQSRTFIPAKVQDNEYLMRTGYVATLQALPEPLRSQMLYGDFTAGRDDDEWQVIPSAWVKHAQDRWESREFTADEVTSCGLDPSRGGRDSTILSKRCGWWFARLEEWKGEATDTGGKVANLVVKQVGSSMCPVHVDVIGIGTSVLDHLEALIGGRAIAINSSERGNDKDYTGHLKFANKRAALHWRMRDLLDPANGTPIALPPDSSLFADLCAATYKLTPSGIQIESKQDIIKRLGRSPDRGDAVVYCAERSAVVSIVRQQRVTVTGSLGRGRRR